MAQGLGQSSIAFLLQEQEAGSDIEQPGHEWTLYRMLSLDTTAYVTIQASTHTYNFLKIENLKTYQTASPVEYTLRLKELASPKTQDTIL